MKRISRLLIANRGEIAIRVIRTAKEMGISAIAIYSAADKSALHVQMADEAYLIEGDTPSGAYLNMGGILDICKKSGADAIHPGYGFLSENAKFAEMVEQAGLVFIGPSQEAIRLMGDKLTSKEAVSKFDVPLIPGEETPLEGTAQAAEVAKKIGYPVLIKASAGGGGKGMRIVYGEEELHEQVERAKSESLSSFGDARVFMEKYIQSPKHIEFQVFGDKHGNIEHLYERECSIQRRYQKVIEEAPSPFMDEELRKKMGQAAINVAKACNYVGAGTVEFIVDSDRKFYFLEMNTRLQVEHPVTEMITGLDLVREQIRVAEGEKLSFINNPPAINGHAIQARVYAEDPENNFLPQTGKLEKYVPADGPGVRTDGGYLEGMEIPLFFDPMIAKLIVHDKNREQAISKLIRAINEFKVKGLPTSLSFCRFAVNHSSFRSGNYTTGFVNDYFGPEDLSEHNDTEEMLAAIIAVKAKNNQSKTADIHPSKVGALSQWKQKRA